MPIYRKADGFENQYLFVIERAFYEQQQAMPLFSAFCVTDIGYFPHAQFHYRNRPEGCPETILLFCVEGKGRCRLGVGESVPVTAGQAIMLPAWQAHEYAAENEAWSVYWMHCSGAYAQELCARIGCGQPFSIGADAQEQIRRLFHQCFDILKRPYYTEEYNLVCRCACTVLAYIWMESKKDATQPTVKGSAAIQTAMEYMKQNLHRSVTLAEIAAAANFSPSHLSWLFKNSTGHAPVEYFIRMKMQAAGKRLYFTDISVKEIAASFGMPDACYFSRIFKKVMGVSPLSYRLQTKG